MGADSQKPKEWVGITNEPNYRFATTHVHVLLLKGHAHLPYLFHLPCPTFGHACLALAHACFTYPW